MPGYGGHRSWVVVAMVVMRFPLASSTAILSLWELSFSHGLLLQQMDMTDLPYVSNG